MSAYITDDETINTVLAFIASDSDANEHIYRSLENMNLVWTGMDARWALGSMMRDLNVLAVTVRYGKDHEILEGLVDYVFADVTNISRIQAYKSLQCWLYQCTEGDVTETDLFKAFARVKDKMAHKIVGDLPEYKKALWG